MEAVCLHVSYWSGMFVMQVAYFLNKRYIYLMLLIEVLCLFDVSYRSGMFVKSGIFLCMLLWICSIQIVCMHASSWWAHASTVVLGECKVRRYSQLIHHAWKARVWSLMIFLKARHCTKTHIQHIAYIHTYIHAYIHTCIHTYTFKRPGWDLGEEQNNRRRSSVDIQGSHRPCKSRDTRIQGDCSCMTRLFRLFVCVFVCVIWYIDVCVCQHVLIYIFIRVYMAI